MSICHIDDLWAQSLAALKTLSWSDVIVIGLIWSWWGFPLSDRWSHRICSLCLFRRAGSHSLPYHRRIRKFSSWTLSSSSSSTCLPSPRSTQMSGCGFGFTRRIYYHRSHSQHRNTQQVGPCSWQGRSLGVEFSNAMNFSAPLRSFPRRRISFALWFRD